MTKGLLLTVAPIMMAHGLIHLMGAAVYLKLATIEGLPFKTTLLGGRWDVGEAGMALFGLLWLLPAAGFVIATLGMLLDAPWWRSMLTIVTIASLLLTALDWQVAYMGAITDLVILIAIVLAPRASAWLMHA